MIDFQTIREIVYTSTTFVSMSDNHDLMASINQFACELIDVTFDSARLREEEIADHGDVVRHIESCIGTTGSPVEGTADISRPTSLFPPSCRRTWHSEDIKVSQGFEESLGNVSTAVPAAFSAYLVHMPIRKKFSDELSQMPTPS